MNIAQINLEIFDNLEHSLMYMYYRFVAHCISLNSLYMNCCTEQFSCSVSVVEAFFIKMKLVEFGIVSFNYNR